MSTDITALATYSKDGFVLSLPATVSAYEIRKHQDEFPRLTALPREVSVPLLGAVLFRALRYRGSEIDAQRVAEDANMLYNELMDDVNGIGTRNLSFPEIDRAVRQAVLDSRKEMYGVNVASIYEAIADYCLGEGQKASRRVQAEKFGLVPTTSTTTKITR